LIRKHRKVKRMMISKSLKKRNQKKEHNLLHQKQMFQKWNNSSFLKILIWLYKKVNLFASLDLLAQVKVLFWVLLLETWFILKNLSSIMMTLLLLSLPLNQFIWTKNFHILSKFHGFRTSPSERTFFLVFHTMKLNTKILSKSVNLQETYRSCQT